MLEDMKFCKKCGKPIPKIKVDTLGRKNTRTSNYCNNNKLCRNAYIREHNKEKYQKYMAKYYLDHPEKFGKKAKATKIREINVLIDEEESQGREKEGN